MENPVSRPLARISGLATDRFGHAVNSEGLLWWLIHLQGYGKVPATRMVDGY